MSSLTTRCAYWLPPLLSSLLPLSLIYTFAALLLSARAPSLAQYLLLFIDTLQQISLGSTLIPQTHHQPHLHSLIVWFPSLPLYLLFTHPDSLVRPCELTDSPTPSTFYPRPLSRTRTLSKSKSHAANHRRHRQSDIANPARHPSQYRNNTPLASR
jgi:hypothetical protein